MATHWDGTTLHIALRVQPRAHSDSFAGLYGSAIKVRIAAPPVDGKANSHLLDWLAREFGVSRSRVTLVRGRTGRNKQIAITSPTVIPAPLRALIPER